MKAPICDVCLNSDLLCKACKGNLDRGIITKADINVSRLIYKVSQKVKSLKDITIRKVIETRNVIIIICKPGDAAKIIGKSGVVIKNLSKNIGKIARVVEETNNYRSFLQGLIYPVPILGINILYTPDKEVLKIRIPKKATLPISERDFVQITKELFNKHVEFVNE